MTRDAPPNTSSGPFPPEPSIVQMFARRAGHVVLGVDSSKLLASAPVIGLRWEQIDVLVTELSVQSDRLRTLEPMVSLL